MEIKKKNLKYCYLIETFKKVLAGNTTMKKVQRGVLLILTTAIMIFFLCENAYTQNRSPMMRMAKIIIDSAQLESYKAALKEGIETAVRVEPGVLSLYAVYEKDNPTHVTVLEIYADQDAYKAHIQTPHFKKYKSTTKDMVKSLELVDVVPIAFGAKAK